MTAAPERSAPAGEQRWRALREALAWLTHPVSLAAIMVLVVNDHILKDAYGNWWTGKLSDFAGLVFFPALLAVVFAVVAPRAPLRPLALASVAMTGVGFAWVKATEVGATTASAAWSVVAGPSVILRDPTDLIALPMLAVAAAIALRPKPSRRAVVAAIALPLAVLATVATAWTNEPSANRLQDNASGPVLRFMFTTGVKSSEESVYQRQEDGSWVLLSWREQRAHNISDRTDTSIACVRADRDLCFRPVASGGIGVERSEDRGETWEIEWALTEAELDVMRDAYDISPAREEFALSTNGIAIADYSDGFEVIAANGHDGLAVRDRNGTWTREGWEGLDCCEDLHVVDLTVERQPWLTQAPVPWPVAWALSSFVLVYAVTIVSSVYTRRLGIIATICGVLAMIIGLASVAIGLKLNSTPPGRIPIDGVELLLIVVPLAAGLVVAYVGAFLLAMGTWRDYLLALGGAGAVALLVAGATLLTNGLPGPVAVAATVALVVGLAVVVPLSRQVQRRYL